MFDAAAAAYIRALLGGSPPDGQPPEAFGEWRDVVALLLRAHAAGGTPAVRAAWKGQLRRNPQLVELVSGYQSDERTADETDHGDEDATDDEAGDDSQPRQRRRSAADRILQYALADATQLFLDQYGQAHALVDGQVVALHRGCYPWLRRLFYDAEERGISGEALQTAAGTLEAKALKQGLSYYLHVRSAWFENTLYVELRPGRVIRVDAKGWDLDADPPVRFRRYANLLMTMTLSMS